MFVLRVGFFAMLSVASTPLATLYWAEMVLLRALPGPCSFSRLLRAFLRLPVPLPPSEWCGAGLPCLLPLAAFSPVCWLRTARCQHGPAA